MTLYDAIFGTEKTAQGLSTSGMFSKFPFMNKPPAAPTAGGQRMGVKPAPMGGTGGGLTPGMLGSGMANRAATTLQNRASMIGKIR